MEPSFIEMEAKRQAMIASFQEVAQAMTKCATLVNDFARASPATLGVSFPTISVSSAPAPVLPAAAAAAPAQGKGGRPRKVSTNPAAAAAVVPAAADSSAIPSTDAELPGAPITAAAVTGAKRGRKSTKEKKPRDPDAPKRPPSAYLLFQNDVREEVKNAHPDLPYKETLSIIAAKWKALSEEDRKEYEGAYKLANEEYKLQDDVYKSGPQAAAFAAQHLHPAPALAVAQGISSPSDSSDDSSDDDSSDDDAVPVKYAPPAAPAPAPVAQQAPRGSLGAAVAAATATPTGNGEKKGKKKAAADPAGEPDKKKKKSKAVDA